MRIFRLIKISVKYLNKQSLNKMYCNVRVEKHLSDAFLILIVYSDWSEIRRCTKIEVFMAAKMWIIVSSVMMPCSVRRQGLALSIGHNRVGFA
jgi:hypothetical protein